MKQYICLSSDPWQAVPTRTQQLMTRLKGAEVLFFEPPPEDGGKAHKDPGRQVRPGLTVYTLPPVVEVGERHRLLFRRSQRKLAKFIEVRMSRHHVREPILWCTSPEAVHLLEYLPHRGLVYDCHQDWSALPIRWESDLALSADVVFAASTELADHLSPCNDNIALLPNGVNYPMFCRDDLPVPPELRGMRRPVLGWAGTIRHNLDLTPALAAAEAMPEHAFVFVGRREENPIAAALERLPNVAFLGQKPLVEVPDYLARFDVCMNFLLRHGAESDVVPTRVYEYLSAGKPIVSMLTEDQVEEFPDVIYGAHSVEEFAQLCGRACTESGDWAKKRRRDYGAAAAWSRRAEEVARILESIGLY